MFIYRSKSGTSRMTQTFSRVSSIASSLNFSLPPFLRMLSQNEASSSALELPATPLLQKTSKASLRAYIIKHIQICKYTYQSNIIKGTLYSKPCEKECDSGNNHSHMPGTCHAAQSLSEQKPEARNQFQFPQVENKCCKINKTIFYHLLLQTNNILFFCL